MTALLFAVAPLPQSPVTAHVSSAVPKMPSTPGFSLIGVQPSVAHHLGYTDRSPSKRLEEFMGDYYKHSRNIFLITRTVEQRLALLPKAKRLPDFRRMLPRRAAPMKATAPACPLA